MNSTLILARRDIEHLLDKDVLFQQIKRGFAVLATAGQSYKGHRFPIALPDHGNAGAGMTLAPGLIPDIPAYTVKVNAKFPQHPPAIRGVVLLHSLEDGGLLAILDSGYLTQVRTAVSGAVGADELARKTARSVAIIGCGAQGRGQLEWMCKIRNIERVFLFDTERRAAQTLASEAEGQHGIVAEIMEDPRDAARRADIVVTATWSKEPFLFSDDIKPGTHITTLGPDGPNEAELSRDLLNQSSFFADSASLQVEMGAIGGVGLDERAISGEIGEVLAGIKPGRRDENEITVYGMVGLPFQDLAVSWQIYQAAIKSDVGKAIELAA